MALDSASTELSATAILATRLRSLHRAARITYRQMSEVVSYSHTTLSRAASSTSSPPSWDVCEAFVKTCQGDIGEFRRLWEAARSELEASRRAHLQSAAGVRTELGPNDVTNVADFIMALTLARLRKGKPSFRRIARDAGASTSTVAAAFDVRRHQPPSLSLVERIVRALGASESDMDSWCQAWTRVAAASPVLYRQASSDFEALRRQAGPLGLAGIYPNRDEALDAFAGAIEAEVRKGASGRIWLIGSSMKGLLQTNGRFRAVHLLRGAIERGCDIRFLVTDPTLVDARAAQEERPPAAIFYEMCQNIVEFEQVRLRRENVRYCTGAPTVFGVCTSDRLLLNPYPFGCEAFKHFSLIFRKTSDADTVFDRYLADHFEKAWEASDEITPRQWADILSRKKPRSRR